ncbi:hypothetical protein MDAP_001857 [Mitosporidium daphniae]|uniref:Uncharacterized protein n=1 Tax=Mitosporidium daphniae TaxID=1485682 RepID=A0A098VN68_9MICR|nr:uncharacterized protein DI09_7p280 [Mitosporidium daphniae]KGG50249.1 hypothetical protein DI09_7p280 [Mitosporidium daphniae]|eukprot:XP_013236676.1 uncharacterized protein DI09_7p280 [Mitosporidium daphniae]
MSITVKSFISPDLQDPERLNAIKSWASSIKNANAIDCVVIFDVWTSSDVELFKQALENIYPVSVTIPIQASMYLFQKWSYGSGILIFLQEKCKFDHRPFIWGPEKDMQYSRSLAVLEINSVKLVIFQSIRKFSNSQKPSIIDCSSRMLIDFEAASIMTSMELMGRSVLIANLPGSTLQDVNSCLSLWRFSSRLNLNPFIGEKSDTTIFYPKKNYEVSKGNQDKDPYVITFSGNTSSFDGKNSFFDTGYKDPIVQKQNIDLFSRDVDILNSRLVEMKSDVGYIFIKILVAFAVAYFLKYVFIKTFSYFSRHLRQKTGIFARNKDFLLNSCNFVVDFFQNAYVRKSALKLSNLWLEYAFVSGIRSAIEGETLPSSLVAKIYHSGLFSFEHKSSQYLTYPFFVYDLFSAAQIYCRPQNYFSGVYRGTWALPGECYFCA